MCQRTHEVAKGLFQELGQHHIVTVWKIRFRFLEWQDFSLHIVQANSGFHPASCSKGTGVDFLEVRKIGHWSPSNVEVNNDGSTPLFLHIHSPVVLDQLSLGTTLPLP